MIRAMLREVFGADGVQVYSFITHILLFVAYLYNRENYSDVFTLLLNQVTEEYKDFSLKVMPTFTTISITSNCYKTYFRFFSPLFHVFLEFVD